MSIENYPEFLKKIISEKNKEIKYLQNNCNIEGLIKKRQSKIRKLKTFCLDRTGIIAEIKGASPSKGHIKEIKNADEIAINFQNAGASAISVLTEKIFFNGAAERIAQVKNNIVLPVLRKDFIFETIQVYETYSLEADIVLVIVRLIDDAKLKDIVETSRKLGLQILFEVHTQEDVRRINKYNPEIIGVNCRNLLTLEIKKDNLKKMINLISAAEIKIAESSIETVEEALKIKKLGYDCLLIGTRLMQDDAPGKFIREFAKELRVKEL